MKKLLFFLSLCAIGYGQTNVGIQLVTVAPSGATSCRSNPRMLVTGSGSGTIYTPQGTPTCTWQPYAGGGGGGGTANQNIRTIGFSFDGGGSALSGTITRCVRVPYAGTITGWYIDADQSGSATFSVRSVAFASYTGSAGYSGYTDVTGGGTAPVLSSAVTATFANLTSWATAVTAKEYCIQLTSPTTITWVNVYLIVSAS